MNLKVRSRRGLLLSVVAAQRLNKLINRALNVHQPNIITLKNNSDSRAFTDHKRKVLKTPCALPPPEVEPNSLRASGLQRLVNLTTPSETPTQKLDKSTTQT